MTFSAECLAPLSTGTAGSCCLTVSTLRSRAMSRKWSRARGLFGSARFPCRSFTSFLSWRGQDMQMVVEVVGMKAFRGKVDNSTVDSGTLFCRVKLDQRYNKEGENFK